MFEVLETVTTTTWLLKLLSTTWLTKGNAEIQQCCKGDFLIATQQSSLNSRFSINVGGEYCLARRSTWLLAAYFYIGASVLGAELCEAETLDHTSVCPL
jgi:hypothetical protein